MRFGCSKKCRKYGELLTSKKGELESFGKMILQINSIWSDVQGEQKTHVASESFVRSFSFLKKMFKSNSYLWLEQQKHIFHGFNSHWLEHLHPSRAQNDLQWDDRSSQDIALLRLWKTRPCDINCHEYELEVQANPW